MDEIKRIYMDDYETKINYLWWQLENLSYTTSGYGNKIPTSKMIKYNNKWHRIYCCIYSNIGSCYIVSNKERIYIN